MNIAQFHPDAKSGQPMCRTFFSLVVRQSFNIVCQHLHVMLMELLDFMSVDDDSFNDTLC